jgi:adrenodoxin-NADP+ reductase
LKTLPSARIDIYEKLPTPYGLVRFGVAPDHPEVKLVTNKFDQLASDPRCWYCGTCQLCNLSITSFIGNVNVGTDISIKDMFKHYHAIVLAYGASSDRVLGIPGESLQGVHSARDFVGWLNGHPDYRYNQPSINNGIGTWSLI